MGSKGFSGFSSRPELPELFFRETLDDDPAKIYASWSWRCYPQNIATTWSHLFWTLCIKQKEWKDYMFGVYTYTLHIRCILYKSMKSAVYSTSTFICIIIMCINHMSSYHHIPVFAIEKIHEILRALRQLWCLPRLFVAVAFQSLELTCPRHLCILKLHLFGRFNVIIGYN